MKALPSVVLIWIFQVFAATIYPQTMDSLFAGLAAKEYLTGKFEAKSLPAFFTLLPAHCAEGEQHLRTEAALAFIKMADSAQTAGVHLKAVSTTRSFFRQKTIWEAKWTGLWRVEGRNLGKTRWKASKKAELIMRYSSMPGTSRHHWGTDLDINSVDAAYFNTLEGRRVYGWLFAHAKHFGFCQVYQTKENSGRSGYEEEKWHWSYLPLSVPFTEKYKALVSNQDISGFLGCEAALEIQAVEVYVLGLNSLCIPKP
jgi:zinc D-Ala-D-Ala carboxypeptidase